MRSTSARTRRALTLAPLALTLAAATVAGPATGALAAKSNDRTPHAHGERQLTDQQAAARAAGSRLVTAVAGAIPNGPGSYDSWYNPQVAVADRAGDARALDTAGASAVTTADLVAADAYVHTGWIEGQEKPTRFLNLNVARAISGTPGAEYWGEHDMSLTFTWTTGKGRTLKKHRSQLVETWRSTGTWTVAIGHRVTTDGAPTDVTSEARHENAACGWTRGAAAAYTIPLGCIGSGTRPVAIAIKLTSYLDTAVHPGSGATDTLVFPKTMAVAGKASYPSATTAHRPKYGRPETPVRQTLGQSRDGKNIVVTQTWETPQNFEFGPETMSWHLLSETDSYDYSVFPLDVTLPDGTVERRMIAHWWDNGWQPAGGEWACGAANTKVSVADGGKTLRMTVPWNCIPWDTVRLSTSIDGPSATIHRL